MIYTDDLIVWWVCQEDVEASLNVKINRRYIQSELESCEGRNGRGRLWVNSYIHKHYGDNIEIKYELFDETVLGKVLAAKYAGIVIRIEDYKFIKDYPGVITDLYLDRWPDYRIKT